MNRRFNRRGSSASSILNVIILGIVLGIGFLIYDRWRTPAPASSPILSTLEPTSTLGTTPIQPQAVVPNTVESRILIPTAGINALVVTVYLDGESWDVSQLGENAGHLQGTAWFGDPGNIALAGHVELADGRPGIFAGIGKLNVGDPIILREGDQEQRYAVSQIKRVSPDDLSVLYPSTTDEMTLITCDSYDFLQNIYQERVVVVAERVV